MTASAPLRCLQALMRDLRLEDPADLEEVRDGCAVGRLCSKGG